ncbi:hypothetical protein ebA3506 [Aromatoleum aromaticum EbN1]|uniref:Uncharacterized protein n=1 Tax=Aromatoleum aromaticum (strain DSM 19018 / LMG 30748 / EbN1) TaxID=76114 RepID=Q5P3L4_AROAE|nr:hypothetical protein ebA3506 [Aromatoleum aromaticum EbN1]
MTLCKPFTSMICIYFPIPPRRYPLFAWPTPDGSIVTWNV